MTYVEYMWHVCVVSGMWFMLRGKSGMYVIRSSTYFMCDICHVCDWNVCYVRHVACMWRVSCGMCDIWHVWHLACVSCGMCVMWHVCGVWDQCSRQSVAYHLTKVRRVASGINNTTVALDIQVAWRALSSCRAVIKTCVTRQWSSVPRSSLEYSYTRSISCRVECAVRMCS